MSKLINITKILEEVLETTPSYFFENDILLEKLNPQFKKSYREKLDKPKINCFGRVIPRIEIVKQNLRKLKEGNTQVWRGLNIKDRRSNNDRRRK